MSDLQHQPRDSSGQFVSLRDFVIAIMNERSTAHGREHELIDRALTTAEKLREEAIDLAQRVVSERLEKLNELRAEVVQDRGQYMTRKEFNLIVVPLQEFKSKALGFGALLSLISAVIGAIVTAIATGGFG